MINMFYNISNDYLRAFLKIAISESKIATIDTIHSAIVLPLVVDDWVQTYDNGDVVKWNGKEDSEHPAPITTVKKGANPNGSQYNSISNSNDYLRAFLKIAISESKIATIDTIHSAKLQLWKKVLIQMAHIVINHQLQVVVQLHYG
jgi:hypothetical protein